MAGIINGIVMMFFGTGTVFGSRAFPPRREIWERCGFYVLLAGVAIWLIAYAVT
jgi:hypothetical protein